MIFSKSCPRCKTGDVEFAHGELHCFQCAWTKEPPVKQPETPKLQGELWEAAQ